MQKGSLCIRLHECAATARGRRRACPEEHICLQELLWASPGFSASFSTRGTFSSTRTMPITALLRPIQDGGENANPRGQRVPSQNTLGTARNTEHLEGLPPLPSSRCRARAPSRSATWRRLTWRSSGPSRRATGDPRARAVYMLGCGSPRLFWARTTWLRSKSRRTGCRRGPGLRPPAPRSP